MTTPLVILGLLVSPFLLAMLVNWMAKRTILNGAICGCVGIAFAFGFTGLGHFIKTESMAEMLPSRIPGRISLVYVSGVVELALAAAVLMPRFRPVIGWSLIAMLALFLPVNVYAALNRVGMGGHQWGPVYLFIRVPLQAILIAWIWWFAIRPNVSYVVKSDHGTTDNSSRDDQIK